MTYRQGLDNSLSNAEILDGLKLEAFADDKIYLTENMKSVLGTVEKHYVKRRKCWLLAFSPFPMFLKGSFFRLLKVGIMW